MNKGSLEELHRATLNLQSTTPSSVPTEAPQTLPTPEASSEITAEDMQAAYAALIEAHEGTQRDDMRRALLEHIATQGLDPAACAALGLGTVENIWSIQDYLRQHPGQLTPTQEEELRRRVNAEFHPLLA